MILLARYRNRKMPRNIIRDSDDDGEPKIGRTRLQKQLGIPSVHSPLRRSSRIKQTRYSPGSPSGDSDTSTSSSQPIKTKSRTSTVDNTGSETSKSRQPSISSDISEPTDLDIVGTPKRVTRRSKIPAISIDTPTKMNTRAASKRLTRAGSETKPLVPAVRSTQRTRATSVEPSTGQSRSQPSTPIKTRKMSRSVICLDTPVKKRLENIRIIDSIVIDDNMDKEDDLDEEQRNSEENLLSNAIDTIDEVPSQESSSSSLNSSSSKKEEKLEEVNKSPSEIEIEKPLNDTSKQPITKTLMVTIENLSNTSVKEQKQSPSNKENQTSNIINNTSMESNIQTTSVASSMKCLTPVHANKSLTEKETNFTKNESSLDKQHYSRESIEAATKCATPSKEVLDNIEEKMDISNCSSPDLMSMHSTKYLTSSLVSDTPKRQSLVHEADNKSTTTNDSILSQQEDIRKSDEAIVKGKRLSVKSISESTEETTKVASKSDKNDETERTIMDTDHDVTKDSNEIELNEISSKREETNKKSLDASLINDNNEMRLVLEQSPNRDETSNIPRSTSNQSDLSIDIPVLPSINKNSNDQSNVMEKQSAIIRDNIIDNTDFTELEKEKRKSSSSKHTTDLTSESSNAALETINSAFNESSENNAVIQDTQSTNVIEASEKFTTNVSSTRTKLDKTVKRDLKRKSADNVHSEKEKESLQLEKQKDTNTNTDPDVNLGISSFDNNDNWDEKMSQKEIDVEICSVHSDSQLVKEPESANEDERDLVFVDKKAWLAAENIKAAKEAEPFEYDSDDTVLLKSRLDAMSTNCEKLSTISEESSKSPIIMTVTSRDKKSLTMTEKESIRNRVDEAIKSFTKQKNKSEKRKNSLNSYSEDEDDLITNDQPVSRLNKSGQKISKATERSFKTRDKSDEESIDDASELNRSSQINKENTSLSKSTTRRKSLNKSLKDTSSRQEDNDKQNISMNKSQEDLDHSEEELNTNAKNLKKLQKKHSLNKSQNKSRDASKKKSLSMPVNPDKSVHLNDDESDDEGEMIISAMDFATLKEHKSFSIIASKGSDTENGSDQEYTVPNFLFTATSSDNDSHTDGSTSIHDDIKREYNLDGVKQKFSDDSVAGDECRASETEVSDPDDDGLDLADFIVEDNEVEEVEEEEEEEEEEECRASETEVSMPNSPDLNSSVDTVEFASHLVDHLMDDEIEEGGDDDGEKEETDDNDEEEAEDLEEEKINDESEKKQDIKQDKVARKKKIKDKNDEPAYEQDVDIMEEENADEENCPKVEANAFNKSKTRKSKKDKSVEYISSGIKMFDLPEIKMEQDNKIKKPNIMENKTILLDTSESSFEKKKSYTRKDEDTISLDTSNSSIKMRRRSGIQCSLKDVTEQDLMEKLNESGKAFTKKLAYKKSHGLMECSTPKVGTSKEKIDFKEISDTPEILEKISITKDTESENVKTTPNTSLKKKKSKKNSSVKEDISFKELNRTNQAEKVIKNISLPSDLAEAIEKAGILKPTSSKKAKLHKTINVTHTESPTIRHLRKEKLSESAPALKFNIEADLSEKALAIKEKKNIAQTKTKLAKNDEEEIANQMADEAIQKPSRKKQKKRKAQVKDSENVTDKLSHETTESDAPKKKKKIKLVRSPVVEGDICKDTRRINKKEKKRKRQIGVIEEDENNMLQQDISTELAQGKKNDELDLSADNYTESKKKRKRQKIEKTVQENLPTKKKKKKAGETPPLQTGVSKLKSDKNQTSNKQQNIAPDTIEPKNVVFDRARDEALEAIRAAEMRIRTRKELKKKARENIEDTIQERALKIPGKKQKKDIEKNLLVPTTSRLKRLPDDVIENLTDLPKKKRKLSRNQERIIPLSKNSSKSKATNAKTDDCITSSFLGSTSGSTTQFAVVDLRKTKKETSKTCSAALAFRERILARNSREPVSAYLVYREKQRATSSRDFNNEF